MWGMWEWGSGSHQRGIYQTNTNANEGGSCRYKGRTAQQKQAASSRSKLDQLVMTSGDCSGVHYGVENEVGCLEDH
eukprot:COSAG06_NODE_15371_length_1076_cov_1.396111_1_plen_76_part_01